MTSLTPRTLRILGTHGIPGNYGGFETAAENLALHLVDRGWRVVVYCQGPGHGDVVHDTWRGVERVTIPESREGWLGTSSFDLKAIRHAIAQDDPSDTVHLTFGYNTGIFNALQRAKRIPNVINMDGMEWTRRRWGLARQAILLVNERFAGLLGDRLIADHPEIHAYLARHFGRRRVVTIAYGAQPVDAAPAEPVRRLGLQPQGYATVICRPIPENSVLEIVEAWSRERRGARLVVLGNFTPATDHYHRAVVAAAGPEVDFPGAIYDAETLHALRRHCLFYLHGHTVGGTNPSLVEAMAASNAVIAHDNKYNRWVASRESLFFSGTDDLSHTLRAVLSAPEQLARLGRANRARFEQAFTWEHIADAYEQVLEDALSARHRTGRASPAVTLATMGKS